MESEHHDNGIGISRVDEEDDENEEVFPADGDGDGEVEEYASQLDESMTTDTRKSSNVPRKYKDSMNSMVDFSGQGLTLVPTSLFKRTDITCLNLSSNNIRNIPSDVGRLLWLTKLDLSRNGLRCQSATDYSTLPMEMTQLDNLIELNISECNLVFIPATIWLLINLQILNLSRNKVRQLPNDIGNLIELRHLNIQQMGLTTIPETIVCCEALETILLYGNDIETLPDSLRDCGHLRVLSVNYRHFCSTLDDVVDSMLRKGQIRSEHLPSVIFEIPKIKRLHLERCMLNDLPERINEGVQEISLSNNYFTLVPSSILQLQHLQRLNLARNTLTELPPEFVNLRSLQWLNLRENCLTDIFPLLSQLQALQHINVGKNKITSLSSEIGQLQELRELHLDCNEILELPEEICSLINLETLDLSYNRLTTLPLRMYQLINIQGAHGFDGLFRIGLWLLGNPITWPEPQVWRCTDHERIWSHLKKLEIRQVKNLHPLKVIVLGNYQCGKTSFVNTLTTGKFQSMTAVKGTTKAFKQIQWRTENRIHFVFFDVGGHEIYQTMWPKFMDADALYVVAFDAFAYWKEGDFDSVIGHWLTLLYQVCPRAVVQLVGLKVDLLMEELGVAEEDPGSVVKEVRPSTGSPSRTTRSAQTARTTRMTRTPHTARTARTPHPFPPNVEVVLQELNELLNEEVQQFQRYLDSYKQQYNINHDHHLQVLPDVSWLTVLVDVSEAFTEFTNHLELLSIDLHLFPHNQDPIPERWLTFLRLLKQSKEVMIISLEEVVSLSASLAMDEAETRQCLQYHHLVGSLFWQGRDPILQAQVFPRVNMLQEKLGRLLRVDMKEALCYEDNLLFKCQANLSKKDFLEMRELLLTRGLLSYSAITCLMLSVSGGLEEMHLFQELAEHFQVGYSMTLPRIPQGRLHQLPVIIFPILNQQLPPEDFYETMWPTPCPEKEFELERRCSFIFPMGKPLGLFEYVAVCIHEKVEGRVDFQGAVVVWTSQEEMLLEEREQEMSEYSLSLVVRRRRLSDEGDLEKWCSAMIQLFLQRRPGTISYIKQQ